MRRILLTKALDDMAIEYSKELRTAKGNYKYPKINLCAFRDAIESTYPNHYEYVKSIIDELDTIIRLHPNEFDVWYKKLNKWNNEDEYRLAMSERILYENEDKEFYKHLLGAMRYDWVQSHLMPSYIERIGIRTCVYCNAQYAVSTDKIDGRHYAHYELDHFKPKSKYPFLCVSFFNLQPSCANCNKHKSKDDSLFNLYTDDANDIDSTLKFRLDRKSVIDFEGCFKPEVLEIIFDADNSDLLRNHEKLFYITKLYTRFKKEASEILWLKKAYNDSFVEQLTDGFKDVFPNGIPNVETLYWGYDMELDKVHSRPLNKLAQDIRNSL